MSRPARRKGIDFDYTFDVDLLVIVHRHVTAVRTVEVSSLLHLVRHHLHVFRVHSVESGTDDQGRHSDLRQIGRAIPANDLPARAKLARSLHRDIHLAVQMAERSVHRLRPLIGWHAQEVLLKVMLHHQFNIPRILVLSSGFKAFDLRQGRLIHGWHQHLLGVLVVGRNAGHHIGDDEALHILLVLERILDGQNTAPRMAEEVEIALIEPQRLPDLLHFLHEARTAGYCRERESRLR